MSHVRFCTTPSSRHPRAGGDPAWANSALAAKLDPRLRGGDGSLQTCLGVFKMKTTYDLEANALYVKFSDEKIDHTEELRPGLILDFDSRGHIVGIEMLDAKQQLSESALKSLAAA